MLLTLLAVSILVSLVAVSTTPQPPDSLRSPLTQYLWPSFWKGQLSLEHISMLGPAEEDPAHSHGAFNLGELMGLQGLPSLLPLLAIWALGGAAWIVIKERRKNLTERTSG